MGVSGLRGGFHLLPGRAGTTHQQVVKDGVVEEHGLLRHDPDLPTQVGQRDLADVDTVNFNGTSRGFIETRHQVGEGGFAGAARADQGADGARGNMDVDVLQDGFARPVGEGDLLERDIARDLFEGQGLRRIIDGDRLVEHHFDALQGGLALL